MAGMSLMFMIPNIQTLTPLVMVIGTSTSFMACKKSNSWYPRCFLSAIKTMYMSSTPSPNKMKGKVLDIAKGLKIFCDAM